MIARLVLNAAGKHITWRRQNIVREEIANYYREIIGLEYQ